MKIKEIGKRSEHYVTRYVLDLQTRPVETEVRIYADENGKYNIPKEYNSEVTYGDTIKALSVLLYSEGVVANDRIAEVINAISNNTLNISSGTVYNFCASFSTLSEESRKQIENDLLNSVVLYTDGIIHVLFLLHEDIRRIRLFYFSCQNHNYSAEIICCVLNRIALLLVRLFPIPII